MDAVLKVFKAQAENEKKTRDKSAGKTSPKGTGKAGATRASTKAPSSKGMTGTAAAATAKAGAAGRRASAKAPGPAAGKAEAAKAPADAGSAAALAASTAAPGTGLVAASPEILPPAKLRARRAVRPSRAQAEAAVRTLLAYIGEDPEREGLLDTPQRVVKAYDELFSGYGEDADELLARTFGEIGTFDDFVLLRDIPFHSHCEHHMVPFVGKAHVAYFPVERVVGLSKIARVVEIFAKRLQTQEHLTSQIVTTLDEGLRPRGVAVMIEAEHMCMSMRGIAKQGVSTITSQFTGVFRDDPVEQVRFITMVRGKA